MIRKKSWKEMMAAIRSTFRKWGVRTYTVEPATAPGRRNLYYHKSHRSQH